MRLAIKSQTFKSARCEFNLSSMEAWSYGWWKFVEVRGEHVYLNMANYSMQTSKQQWNVKKLLDNMQVKYRTVYIHAGLQAVDREISDVKHTINEILGEIANPRSRAKTNVARKKRIKYLENRIEKLKAYKKLSVRSEWTLNFSARKYIDAVIEAQRKKTVKNHEPVLEHPFIPGDHERPKTIESVPSFSVVTGEKVLTGRSIAKLTLIKGGKE